MSFAWPEGFARVPPDDWTTHDLESLALKYDTVENHGWYDNLEPTVDEMAARIRDGDVVVDYSGGTGILLHRFFAREPERKAGFIIVDASPKFLRLALEKLGADDRVAFRWIRYLKADKRLQTVDEVLGPPLSAHGVNALTSTNAIHLYYDLADTLAAWKRVLATDGWVFVQSGNIRNPRAKAGEWIIDETVGAIHQAAMEIVREDPALARYRAGLDDATRMARYDELRAKYFLPVRPLEHYRACIEAAGFEIVEERASTIAARTNEWYDFLAVYHEGVLGWLGGTEKIDGAAAPADVVTARLALIRRAMDRVFGGREGFDACWTYLTCRPRA